MSGGARFHVRRFSPLDLDDVWLRRECRAAWDHWSGRAHGVTIVDAPDGGSLVVKVGGARLFRGSRSLGAARIARCLRAAGVPTPEVHAVCTQGRGRLCALVMGHVPAVDQGEALRSDAADDWVASMARSIAKMHGAGIRHRDLKGSNVLLVRGNEGPEAWIIDLDGASVVRFGVSAAKRARDLARLELSLDQLGAVGSCLLERYAAFAGWGPDEARGARGPMDAYKVRKRTRNERSARELT